jgi:hypothetical protein
MKTNKSGMRGDRSRNPHGTLREKRGDTFVASIEQKYGRDFGVRGDMHLDTLLKKTGFNSLNDLVQSKVGR